MQKYAYYKGARKSFSYLFAKCTVHFSRERKKEGNNMYNGTVIRK